MLVMAATADDALLTALRGPRNEAAVAELHELLLRAARFELARRAVRDDDLAHQAADDALVAVLAKLDTFRGASRFTTWAYKFALLEAGVKARRRAWQGRELAGRRRPAARRRRTSGWRRRSCCACCRWRCASR